MNDEKTFVNIAHFKEDIDTEIAHGLLNKDTKSLELLINKYSSSIHYIVSNILHGMPGADIEECVSETFFKVWHEIERYDDNKPLKSFVFMLARYTALDYKRKLSKNLSLEQLNDDITANVQVEEEIIDKELQQLLIKTVEGFNNPDKEIFKRRYFFHENIVDIAKSLELSRQAVDNRLNRMRVKLKEVLFKEDK